jgi:hypothetical protein
LAYSKTTERAAAVSGTHLHTIMFQSPSNSVGPKLVVMSGVDFNGKAYRLEYLWSFSDAGRTSSKRPRQINDCTVRALALTCSLPYDDAYDILKVAGRKSSRGFQFSSWLNAQVWAERISFPAVKGKRRMNPASFVQQFPKGRYICQVAKHVFAVVDGLVIDSFESRPDRCIYSAWTISAPYPPIATI